MPRPKKCRKVCHLPHEKEFIPANGCNGRPFIVMTVDEYETIRLIDKQGFSQEECAGYMQVARTTAQQIYNSARGKIALASGNKQNGFPYPLHHPKVTFDENALAIGSCIYAYSAMRWLQEHC